MRDIVKNKQRVDGEEWMNRWIDREWEPNRILNRLFTSSIDNTGRIWECWREYVLIMFVKTL